MNVAVNIPNPWKVTPATRIGSACSGDWLPPITLASVPHNMTGNTGRIQAGVIDCIVNGFPVKRKWYCPTASKKVQAAYIQNRTRRVVRSHGPQ